MLVVSTYHAYTSRLVVIECCSCHMDFGMPEELHRKALGDKTTWFYCPRGHSQHFTGTSDAQKIERLEAQVRRERAAAETTEHRRRAQKAVNTKLKQRIAAGKCLACSETFSDLAAHMTTEHPGFAEREEVTA